MERINGLVGIAAFYLLLWPSCSARQSTAPQQPYDAEAAKRDRQVFQDQAEAKLHELDRQIDSLEAKIKREDKVKHKEFAPQIAELERQRAEAHEKLEKLKASSQAAWADMKVGINEAMNALQAAYKKADSHFN